MRLYAHKFLKFLSIITLASSMFLSVSAPVFASGPAPCSDGLMDCGWIGSGGGVQYSSSCTLVGKANQGGQTCNTSMGTGTFVDPLNSSTSYFTFHINQGVIPTSVASTDPYNTDIQFYSNMTGSLIFDPIDDNGSVTVGSITSTYNGCTCGINDVTGTGCGASNARTIKYGTVSPGNAINLSVTNMCKPNDDMNSSYTGAYGGGSAQAYITDGAVQCHTAQYYSWMIANGYMDASNMGRSYVPDASAQRCKYDGIPPVCAIDNFSPASTSVATGNGTTLSFLVHGTAGQNWSIAPSVIPISSGNISGATGSGGGSTGSLTTATTYTLNYGACHASTTVTIKSVDVPAISVSPSGNNTVSADSSGNATLQFKFMNTTPGTMTHVDGSSGCTTIHSGNFSVPAHGSCDTVDLTNP